MKALAFIMVIANLLGLTININDGDFLAASFSAIATVCFLIILKEISK